MYKMATKLFCQKLILKVYISKKVTHTLKTHFIVVIYRLATCMEMALFFVCFFYLKNLYTAKYVTTGFTFNLLIYLYILKEQT